MLRLLLVASIALLAAACSPPADEDAAPGDMADMNMNAPVASGPIEGSGTVTAVDAAAGTVTVNHGPIAAIDWPSMTMQFTAEDASMLQGVEVGDTVAFEIKSVEESQVITAIREQ